jgi:hypothetical protein
MFDLTSKITEWFRELLIQGIIANFTGMFDELNGRVGDIATQVGTPPNTWNPAVFGLIRTLSETVIIPVAGMILTFILCYELIHMVIERNNMNEAVCYRWCLQTLPIIFMAVCLRLPERG